MEVESFFGSSYKGSKDYTQQSTRTANATGFGAAADDYMDRGIDLNEQLVRNKPATFFMRVSGNSMIDAGITHGDIVIVDKSITPINGKVVIAVIDGEMIIRRYHKSFNKLLLVADNKKNNVIDVSEFTDFRIWGVVIYLIRGL
jgi:DNA polymerase V